MTCIQPGEHGSTYGGNSLGCAVAMTALNVIVDEDLCSRAEHLGNMFRSAIESANSPFVQVVRGRGLFNAIVIDESKGGKGRTAWQLCLLLKSRGVLAKPTHNNIIRFSPPLVISEQDLQKAISVIMQSLEDFDTIGSIPGDEDGFN